MGLTLFTCLSGSDPVYRPCLSCLSQHLARGTVSTLHNDVTVPVGDEAVVGDAAVRAFGVELVVAVATIDEVVTIAADEHIVSTAAVVVVVASCTRYIVESRRLRD
jgi:hypothetical protein